MFEEQTDRIGGVGCVPGFGRVYSSYAYVVEMLPLITEFLHQFKKFDRKSTNPSVFKGLSAGIECVF